MWRLGGLVWLTLAFVAGGVCAALLAIWSQDIQHALAWRGDRIFKRVPDRQAFMEQSLLGLWQRGQELLPHDAIVLLGDSHLQGLPAASLGPRVVNLSIGGLTAERMQGYLRGGSYPLPPGPRMIVLWIGHNDLAQHDQGRGVPLAVASILKSLPASSPLVLMEILPARKSDAGVSREDHRAKLNLFLADQCRARSKCSWLGVNALKSSDGSLNPAFSATDGIHLNAEGYKVLHSLLSPLLLAEP